VAARGERATLVRAGVRIEIVTVIWMTLEAVLAIGAGVAARSVLLTAFGADSVIELVTGGVLLWRLATEAQGGSLARVERAENRAAWIAGVGLVLLCAYVIAATALSLLTHTRPEASYVGIGVSLVAIAGMPVLARRKRVIAARIESAALRGDAACSITCAYMAATLLAGLALNAALGWWWAEGVAALGLLYWLGREAREALQAARAGRGGCGCAGDACAES
jgi:divalent metal cation (Fe/Co/Zn/Cd) transporter